MRVRTLWGVWGATEWCYASKHKRGGMGTRGVLRLLWVRYAYYGLFCTIFFAGGWLTILFVLAQQPQPFPLFLFFDFRLLAAMEMVLPGTPAFFCF